MEHYLNCIVCPGQRTCKKYLTRTHFCVKNKYISIVVYYFTNPTL